MSLTLHVGAAVLDYLRDTITAAPEPQPAHQALTGVPVILEARFPMGRWEIREDGRTTSSGQVGADDDVVVHAHGRLIVFGALPTLDDWPVPPPILVPRPAEAPPWWGWGIVDPSAALRVTGT